LKKPNKSIEKYYEIAKMSRNNSEAIPFRVTETEEGILRTF